MPLKHLTETVLVILLGAVTILTGILVDTLPNLPQGILPWGIVFIVSLLYPLVLYPLFRSNRADYFFRVLHFAPAFIVLVWLIIQLLALRQPSLVRVHDVYTWGFTIIMILITFILLEVFCFHVIRRRVPRVTFLTLMIIPFIAFAFMGEQGTNLDQRLSLALWQGDWWNMTGTGTVVPGGPQIAMNTQSSASSIAAISSASSSAPKEEAWREKLRELSELAQRRSSSSISMSSAESSSVSSAFSSSSMISSVARSVSSISSSRSSIRVIAQVPSSKSSASSVSSVMKPTTGTTGSAPAVQGPDAKPPVLVSSGPALWLMTFLFVVLYSGILHQRARRRM